MTNCSRGFPQPLAIAMIMGLTVFQSEASARDIGAAPQFQQVTVAQAQTDHNAHDMRQAAPMTDNVSYKVGNLVVMSPWSRATPGGAKIGGGYLQIANHGTSTDRLVGATVGFADHVEIHEMSMTDGIMKMRALTDGLEIKPGETVELKPGGFHMMFMDLKQPLKEGNSLRATLMFEKAGPLEINFSVNGIGANSNSNRH